MLSDNELKEIKERAEKSAEKWEGTSNVPFYVHLKRPRMSMSKHDSEEYNTISYLHYDDGAFIANARKDMLKLLNEINELREELGWNNC